MPHSRDLTKRLQAPLYEGLDCLAYKAQIRTLGCGNYVGCWGDGQ